MPGLLKAYQMYEEFRKENNVRCCQVDANRDMATVTEELNDLVKKVVFG
jgi:thymidylate kinase